MRVERDARTAYTASLRGRSNRRRMGAVDQIAGAWLFRMSVPALSSRAPPSALGRNKSSAPWLPGLRWPVSVRRRMHVCFSEDVSGATHLAFEARAAAGHLLELWINLEVPEPQTGRWVSMWEAQRSTQLVPTEARAKSWVPTRSPPRGGTEHYYLLRRLLASKEPQLSDFR